MIFGYARVSTRDQDFEGQVAELKAAGCERVFHEKASGAKTDRTELKALIHRMRKGDVLVVSRLDRLARSTRDLLNILDAVAKQGAGFRSIKEAWVDTTTPLGRFVTTILGGVAEFERELIKARTSEGRKRAQEKGIRFGRPHRLTPEQRESALASVAAGETHASIARSLNVHPTTIGRLYTFKPVIGSLE